LIEQCYNERLLLLALHVATIPRFMCHIGNHLYLLICIDA